VVTPLSIDELYTRPPAVEYGRRIKTASVAWIDQEALLRDFPGLRELLGLSPPRSRAPNDTEIYPELISWILETFPVISDSQMKSMAVNNPISVDSNPVPLIRPSGYGRAALLDLTQVPPNSGLRGIVDIKGCGVRDGMAPMRRAHATGLLMLSEAIADIASQRIVERALGLANVDVTGIPVYAVICLGFDGHPSYADAGMLPAAIMVRGARSREGLTNAESSLNRRSDHWNFKLRVELVLRHFGITSVLEGRTSPAGTWVFAPKVGALLDIIRRPYSVTFASPNIQSTRDFDLSPLRGELVDFGHFSFVESFSTPIMHWRYNSDLGAWKNTVLWPDDPSWVQPSPLMRVSKAAASRKIVPEYLSTWGGYRSNHEVEATHLFGLETAYGVTNGRMSLSDVELAIRDFTSAFFEA